MPLKKSALLIIAAIGISTAVIWGIHYSQLEYISPSLTSFPEFPDTPLGYADAIEDYQKEREGQYFDRVDKYTLVLKKDGHTMTFKGMKAKKHEMNSIYYTYREYIQAIDCFIIQYHYHHWGNYRLVNLRSKSQTALERLPVISPDHRHIISANKDMESAYSDNGITLIRIDDGRFITVYEEKTKWGASNPVWINNKKIKLTKHSRRADSPFPPFNQSTIYLQKKKGEWVIVDPATSKWTSE